MYISDGEFMQAMARKADQHQFDREYNDLQQHHATQMRNVKARHCSELNFAHLEAERVRIELEARAGFELLVEKLQDAMHANGTYEPQIVLALRGQFNADLRDRGFEPSIKNPEADLAWAVWEKKCEAEEAKHAPTIQLVAERAEAKVEPSAAGTLETYAQTVGVPATPESGARLARLRRRYGQARTKHERDVIDHQTSDILDPSSRETERENDSMVRRLFLERREGKKSSEAVLRAMFSPFPADYLHKTVRRVLLPEFSLMERLAYTTVGKLPHWVRLN